MGTRKQRVEGRTKYFLGPSQELEIITGFKQGASMSENRKMMKPGGDIFPCDFFSKNKDGISFSLRYIHGQDLDNCVFNLLKDHS